MNKTIPFKLNNSHNRLLLISLIFAILLISSPLTSTFTQMTSAQTMWTVTFETGNGTNEPNRVYTVQHGTLLKDISGVDLSAPVAKPGSLFIGWLPVINENEAVRSDLTYTAQWITDFSSPSPTINHRWSLVLNNPAYIRWTVPTGALSLDFNDVSNSGQTYLDYAYMVIDDSGSASIYFLCLTRHGGSTDYVNYFGIPAAAVASTTYSGVKYSVWRLDLPEYVVRTIMSGGALSGSFNCFVGSGGNSINGVTLTFTNVRVVAEHYIYVNDPYDPMDAVLYRITPIVGVIGQSVTANPLHIVGHTYDDVTSSASKSGIVPSTGSLTLKLYYQKNSAYLWNIRSILEGVEEVHTVYNGQVQKLSDFIDPDLLADGKLFTIIWPPYDSDDPDAKYLLEGGVYLEDPAGVDVGIYTQDLAVTPDYKIYYHGNYFSANATLVTLDDGLEYEDITYAMGLPLPVPVSLIIDRAPLTITTASASKEYDGTELTKTDDAPIIEGLVDGIIVPYVFTATSHNHDEYNGLLVNGETVGFIFTGTQTYSGTSYNTYEIVWVGSDDPDNSFTANNRNYAIVSENLGILEVYTLVTYYENFPNGVTDFDGTAPVDNNHYYENDLVTVLGENDLTVYGYRFIGWNTELDGTGTLYDPGDDFRMPDGSIELYAQWVVKDDIVVTFDVNAPVGATVVSGPSPLSKVVDFGSA
ncbi:MAG: InlB B-repeat-containing protein, partial [Candidatus Bathyarchaeota archaeon]|nr:InlB B-repeat-containing protein [Candidatus Termiticorpusculum sp.]